MMAQRDDEDGARYRSGATRGGPVLLLAVVAALLASACGYATPHLQGPATLKEDEQRTGVGALLPVNVLLSYRTGISDAAEFQVHAALPVGAGVALKLGMTGDPVTTGFASSLSLTADFQLSLMTASRGGPFRWESDGVVPFGAALHLGYRFSERFAVYVTPRYQYRALGPANADTHAWAATAGFTTGAPRRRWYFEFNVHDDPFLDLGQGAFDGVFYLVSIGTDWN